MISVFPFFVFSTINTRFFVFKKEITIFAPVNYVGMRRLAFILSLYLFMGFGKTGAQQLVLKNYAWQGDSVRQAVKIVPPIYSLWKKNSLLSPPGQELTGSIMLQNQYALVNEVDVSPFRCGPFWVPAPPPLFENCTQYHDTVGEAFLCGFIEGAVNGVFDALMPSKPTKKERQRALAKKILSHY